MADTPAVDTTTVKNTGNALAQQKFGKPAKTLIKDLSVALKSPDIVAKTQAEFMASDFVNNLLLLVLYQEIQSEYKLEPYKWVNMFDDEKVEAGNTKQYIRNIITGADAYDPNMFIPTKATQPKVASTTISLYDRAEDGNVILGQNAYQFKKPLTITAQQWIPFFTSGKLQQFIADITKLINETYEMFKISYVQSLIMNMVKTDSGIFKKRITGKATNLLTAFTTEIFPEITRMRTQISSDYNLVATTPESINSTRKDEMIMLMNQDLYTKFVGGVLAPVFNNKLVDFGAFIPSENVFPLAKQLVVGDSDTAITAGSDVLDTNTIIVLNKNAIKHLWWIEKTENQQWAENMAIQVVLHIWGAFGVIPWGQGFVYTNENLNKVGTLNSPSF